MGCAQSTGFSRDSPPQGLVKMKQENGYVKGGHVGARRSTGARQEAGIHQTKRGHVEGRRSTGVRQEADNRYIKREHVETRRRSTGVRQETANKKPETRHEVENRINPGRGRLESRRNARDDLDRLEQKKKAGEDEQVDGWPKWLIDNIPKEVLRNIVPKSADSYTKIDKVGQGTYSNVYKARDKHTGKIVALKKVRVDTSEPESVKFMAREIMILQKLDHPNIVKLEGLATSRMHYSLYLVFDYMQTDLARILSRPDERLTEPQIKCYMQQLLLGLEHCHERGILHRDIKGSNLLISRNGMLKVADFGLANFFDTERRHPLTNRVVTLWYRAPELLLGSTDYGPGIDLWSAGCLLAEMFAGRPIFPGRTEVEQIHRIFKLCGTPSDEFYRRLRLSKDLKPPQTYKSVFQEAFRHFPRSSLGLLNTLLALDPGQRGSARSALQNEFFHTSPFACDLSGLPAIHVEDNDEALIIDKRKHRTSRMRRRKKNAAERTEGEQKRAETSVFTGVTGSSTTSTSSASAQTQGNNVDPHHMSPKPEAHPNADKNVKNQPLLPAARKDITGMYPLGTKRLDLVQRSASSREYLTSENGKLHRLHGGER